MAADLVERRLGLVAADWQSSCLGVDDDADAMLRIIAAVLHDCGGNTRAGHDHPTATDRFEAARHRFEHLDVGAITCLREVLRRQVLLDLPPPEALAALHCVSATLDELHRLLSIWIAARLQRLAYVDELTGLGNRRAALESSHSFVATAVRHDRPLTAVVVDVDGLKAVNDGEGHEAGDALLRRLADAFRSGLRDGDTAYRTGGDEFLVLLPETTRADAEVLLARVREAGAPSFSYGSAQAPEEAMTVDDVVRLADQRLLEGRRLVRAGRSAPAPAPATVDRPTVGRFLVGTGLLAFALAAVLGSRSLTTGFDLRDAATVTGVGIIVALLAAAAQSGRRSPAVATVLAPLLGLAAASAAAPMLDAETRPSERIEHLSQPTTVSTTSSGRAAVVEVPTGTIPRSPQLPAWLGTSSTTAPPPGDAAAALVAPTTTTTTAPPASTTTAPPSTTTTTTSTTTTTTTVQTTTTTATLTASGASTTTTTSAPPRAVAVDDDVATERRNLVVHVLANDRAPGTALDPGTVSIVRRPSSGTAVVRDDGSIAVRGGDEPEVRFQYQVCATNRTCARAWVTIRRVDPPPRRAATTTAPSG